MSNKVFTLGFAVTDKYKKNQLVSDIQYTMKAYCTKIGKNPKHVFMNVMTGTKVKQILEIADNNLVGVCGLSPVYDDSVRDNMLLLGDTFHE